MALEYKHVHTELDSVEQQGTSENYLILFFRNTSLEYSVHSWPLHMDSILNWALECHIYLACSH